MLLPSLALVLLAASPGSMKLAAPGFTTLNLPDNAAHYYSDHFAHQLDVEGIEVITPSQIAALLGLERQKQLLGCDGSSCMAELANALGADGVITGSLGKFGDLYQVDIKILAASDGHALGIHTARVTGDAALLDEYSRAAKRLAAELKKGKGAPAQATAPASSPPVAAATPPAVSTPPAGSSASCIGQACTKDAECCTGQCLVKKCAPAGACNSEGGKCRDATDCCAGFACDKSESGTCKPMKPGSFLNGYSCDFHDQCSYGFCSEAGLCVDPTETENRCRGVGTYCNPDTHKTCCAPFTCHASYPARCCLPLDSKCIKDESCCSGKCENGECS